MSTESPLSVLFLWHQHQPFYKDPLSNRYELPWVRLHASKDYYDMAALLEEFPKIRANFNLVPSLLVQLDDYANGKAQEKFLGLTLKAAQDLSFEDRIFLLTHFFMVHWENMIDPYPRYRELLEKRGRFLKGEDLARVQGYFKEQDWRDLQSWFTLTWFDPLWRERDEFIRGLHNKGKSFTEEEKQTLVQKQLAICGQIIHKHKELMDRGQIEVTTTPFYHPILPLLCDTDSAKMAMKQLLLPNERFVHPEDARTQVERALADYARRFGRPAQGVWPSEGAVSEEVAQLFADCGVRWIATDEGILARSVAPVPFAREDLYEPYRLERGGKSLQIFFRDHELSDAIGFVYASWRTEDAVNDFIKRLHDIRRRLKERDGTQPRPHVVPVILDGENCWEYYAQDGLPFLRLLYQRLSEDPLLQTVRASDYLEQHPPIKTLPRLWSGSWINNNFAIWIGHSEDNRAWDLLSRTRQFLTRHLTDHPELAQSSQAALAWEEIYIAEGSDWCWWLGEDHSSASDDMFDYLFRKHLMNVYTVLSVNIPEDLHIAIKTKRRKVAIQAPVDFITPKIDGRVTSYFEWQSAGIYQTEAGSTGTMHRAQNLVKTCFFGFDLQNLYMRFDLSRPLDDPSLEGTTLRIIFLNPLERQATVEIRKNKEIHLQLTTLLPDNKPQTIDIQQAAANKIIEIAIPLEPLNPPHKDTIQWVLVVERQGLQQERWPVDAIFSVPYPTQGVFAEAWML
jgi:alpha-amylase/alpha-mannosidase (GH57 family)